MTARYDVALFRGARDVDPRPDSWTWDDLVARLGRHEVRASKDGPCWSPTRYRRGYTRSAPGVESLSCFVADVDDGHPPELVHAALERRGVLHLIHSSFSSTPARPKYRIVVPLSVPVPSAEWRSVWPVLVRLLADGHVDPGTGDRPRMYYLPSCPAGSAPFVMVGGRDPFDWRTVERLPADDAREGPVISVDLPDEVPPAIRAAATEAVAGDVCVAAFGRPARRPIDIRRGLEAMRAPHLGGAGHRCRHVQLSRWAREFRAAGFGPAEVLALTAAANARCHDPKAAADVRRCVRFALGRGPRRAAYAPPPYRPPDPGEVARLLPGQALSPTKESCGQPAYRGHNPDGRKDVLDVMMYRRSCNRLECPSCHPRIAHRDAAAGEAQLAAAVGAPDARASNAPLRSRVADVRFWARRVFRFVAVPPPRLARPSSVDQARAIRHAAEYHARRFGMGYGKVTVHDGPGVAPVADPCAPGIHFELVGFLAATPKRSAIARVDGDTYTSRDGWVVRRVPVEGQVHELLRALLATAVRFADPETAEAVVRGQIGRDGTTHGGAAPEGEGGAGTTSATPRVPTLSVTTVGTPPTGGREAPKLPDWGYWCEPCGRWEARESWARVEPAGPGPPNPPPRCPARLPAEQWRRVTAISWGPGRFDDRVPETASAFDLATYEEQHRGEWRD